MVRARLFLLIALPLLLAGCYSDQKRQLASCEASATRSGAGQPLKSVQACMDSNGYNFVGYANPSGETIVCDLPAVIRGAASADGTDALCFEPKGWLALKIYRWEVPDRGLVQKPADST
jgi:hypothetical protein